MQPTVFFINACKDEDTANYLAPTRNCQHVVCMGPLYMYFPLSLLPHISNNPICLLTFARELSQSVIFTVTWQWVWSTSGEPVPSGIGIPVNPRPSIFTANYPPLLLNISVYENKMYILLNHISEFVFLWRRQCQTISLFCDELKYEIDLHRIYSICDFVWGISEKG